jgi:hypothetical protein
MYVQQNASIERFTLPGIDHQTLADARRGLRALSVWRQSLAPKAIVSFVYCVLAIAVFAGYGMALAPLVVAA